MTRLPRLHRSPERLSSTQLTGRSEAILKAVERYRVLSTSMIIQLVGGNEDVTHRHLQRLYHLGRLDRYAPHQSKEFIYVPPSSASEKNDTSSKGISDFQASAGRLLFLQHELMISRFHYMLEQASDRQTGKIALVDWHQGTTLWNSVKLSSSGRRLPHRPDAFFTLHSPESPEGRRRSHFLYEADRGTSTLSRLRDKLTAHFEFVLQGKHQTAYGIKRLRAILIEASSIDRAERLREVAHSICDTDALFWFTCSEIFLKEISGTNRPTTTFLKRPEIIFAPIWISQIGDDLQALVE